MDVKISKPAQKLMLGIILAATVPLLAMQLYANGYYHYLRAKLSLYSAGIETTKLWEISNSGIVCGRTKGGGWVLVLDVIYRGVVAEDGCIENVPSYTFIHSEIPPK
ncbi:hypothetical protein FK216_15600 [Moraxellaceae bacterium AER2_44_116]|nr:hypothetical protein FK216_15600 [Moraxellaceae bacterium AER2_44_116]